MRATSRLVVALLALTLAGGARAAPLEIGGFVGGAPGGAGGSFVEPVDVTVFDGDAADPFDDKLFVVEGAPSNSRVQRLDSDGNFELAWGRDAVRGGGDGYEVCRLAARCRTAPAGGGGGELREPAGIAVHPATGDVYVMDAGNRRVQQFHDDGRRVRAWDVGLGAGAGARASGSIAIDPRPPHDVFVGDPATDRVLRFSARGRFARAWGWGVRDGRRRFQACDARERCRRGARARGGSGVRARWPGHLAVDAGGIVYASVFLGSVFEDDRARTRIERFDGRAEADPERAGAALLHPLRAPDPYRLAFPGEPPAVLTNAATEGLEIDPASGDLLAIGNPFGTSKLDAIHDPGAGFGKRRRPRVTVVDTLPFLQNVTGIGIAARDGLVFLTSGALRQETGRGSFTGCSSPRARHDCHGLIVLAAGGRAAVAQPGPPGAGPTAWIDPGGAARYELQVSRDGRSWRSVGQPRYAAGDGYEPISASTPAAGPRATAYRTRVVAVAKAEAGLKASVSNLGTLLVGD